MIFKQLWTSQIMKNNDKTKEKEQEEEERKKERRYNMGGRGG